MFSTQVNDIILHACIVEANIDRSYEIKVSNTIVLILKALKYTMLHFVQYHYCIVSPRFLWKPYPDLANFNCKWIKCHKL